MTTTMRVKFGPMARYRDMPTIFMLGRVKRVWHESGQDIIAALETTSGLQFQYGVTVRVGFVEADELWQASAGHSGRRAIALLVPRHDRIDFDDLVVWLLMHELGHRLLEYHGLTRDIRTMSSEDEWDEYEHRQLFVFLIDAILTFGDRGTRILRNFPEYGYASMDYGHTRAWRWASKLSVTERRERTRSLTGV